MISVSKKSIAACFLQVNFPDDWLQVSKIKDAIYRLYFLPTKNEQLVRRDKSERCLHILKVNNSVAIYLLA